MRPVASMASDLMSRTARPALKGCQLDPASVLLKMPLPLVAA
jgi:hypothetical protein